MKKITTILIAVLLLVSITGCAASKGSDASAAKKLTKAESQGIALDHANLKENEVTGLHAEYDFDDGIPQYEVEFHQGDYEYDYTIHAETGKVLHWNKEYDPVKPQTKPTEPETPTTAPTEPKPTEPETPTTTPTEPKPTEPETPTTAPTEPKPQRLTREQAQTIALEHAGLTAKQVKGLEIEFDVDDGVPEYSVEFYHEGWEYDYEIHAESGKLLDWDKEYDPY